MFKYDNAYIWYQVQIDAEEVEGGYFWAAERHVVYQMGKLKIEIFSFA